MVIVAVPVFPSLIGASRGDFAGKSHIIFNITVAMKMPKAESGKADGFFAIASFNRVTCAVFNIACMVPCFIFGMVGILQCVEQELNCVLSAVYLL